MFPNFADQDYVLGVSWPGMSLHIGDVVIVAHPQFDTIIKRIAHIDNQGAVLLCGDNILSTETQSMGRIGRKQVQGKVVWHFCTP